MPGVYKIPMVRMTEMSDEAPECKGLKVPHSEMGVWVKAQAVRFSRNGCYETPWHVTGVSKLSGPEGTPKGMYVQIGLGLYAGLRREEILALSPFGRTGAAVGRQTGGCEDLR